MVELNPCCFHSVVIHQEWPCEGFYGKVSTAFAEGRTSSRFLRFHQKTQIQCWWCYLWWRVSFSIPQKTRGFYNNSDLVSASDSKRKAWSSLECVYSVNRRALMVYLCRKNVTFHPHWFSTFYCIPPPRFSWVFYAIYKNDWLEESASN